MRITYLLVVCFLIFSFVTEEEKIPWSENYQLKWSDFKAPSSYSGAFVASTSSGIAYSLSYSNNEKDEILETNIIVTCNFYPNKSWYSKKDASDYILKHEQTHFDISELHARILRMRIEQAELTKNISSELENLFYKTEDERVALQGKFDKETDHSKNSEKEKEWETYIAQQLIKYERWK